MDYLDEALGLASTLPPDSDKPKLHRLQCSLLQKKLNDTLRGIEDSCPGGRSDRERAGYGEVLKELHRVVQKVKTFVDDCFYNDDKCSFTLAAIRVTSHKEKFLQYHVELDFCLFLVKRVRGAENFDSGHLQFEWEHQRQDLRTESSRIQQQDEEDLKNLLHSWIAIPGPHQAICWALGRGLEAGSESDNINLPKDLEKPDITSRKDKIGSGGFGNVYEIGWEGKTFAVKSFNVGSEEKINEVEIMKSCCHPHVTNLILAHKEDSWQYLMMDRLSMDLESYILEKCKGRKKIPIVEAVDMISQVCEGMFYLDDDKHVSHRDLKPGNILVKEISDVRVKDNQVVELQVTDFGVSKVRERLGTSSNSENPANIGTRMYRAAEMVGEPGKSIRGSSRRADIYSFGVMCSFILTGETPFSGCESISAIIESIKRGVGPALPEDCPQELSSLLKKCWHFEPKKRPENFSVIRATLRQLKVQLLLASAGRSSGTWTFNDVDRPLNILVLGDSELVRATVGRICGSTVRHKIEVKPHGNFAESRCASPPMRIYHGDTEGIGNNTTAIKSFVKGRNNPWHHEQVEKMYLKHFQDPGGREASTSFPNSTSRLHMVWVICRTSSDLSDDFEWSEITTKLCGLPVQILVIEDKQDQNEYNRIYSYFPKNPNIEQHIVRVGRDVNWRMLYKTCSIVKTRAEIENVATIITFIKDRLGRSGVNIPVGVGGRISRAKSLSMSGEFVLSFLCKYWDIPLSHIESIHLILQKRTNFESEPPNISIQPGEFVIFCIRVATMILYSASNPEYDCSWAPAESLKVDAQVIFSNGISPEGQMKRKHIQKFLENAWDRVSEVKIEGVSEVKTGVSEDRRNSIRSNRILSVRHWISRK